LVCLLAAGCGKKTSYKLAPVSGVVTLDGKPVPGLCVSFQPVAGKAGPDVGPSSIGFTGPDGRYTLQAIQTRQPGAVVGKHNVLLSTVSQEDPDSDLTQPPPKELLPPQYRGKALAFEVPAAGTDKADFPLTSR